MLGVSLLSAVVALLLSAPLLNRRFARCDSLPVNPPKAIVVLSSGVERTGALDVYGSERLRSATVIARRYPSAHILTTRVQRRRAERSSDSAQRAMVQEAQVGDRLTILEGSVASTRDEAELAGQHLVTTDTIVVVTSISHTGRACATFERIGFTVICRAADVSSRRWWQHVYDFLYERAATLKYRSRGWID